MGAATYLIIFWLFVAIFFQIADPTNYQTPWVQLVHDMTGQTPTIDAKQNLVMQNDPNQFCLPIPALGNKCFATSSIPGLFLVMLFAAGIAGAFGIIPGLGSFPNPYLIFAALGVFMLGFFTFPISLMTQANAPLAMQLILIPFSMITYIVAFVSWYKGGGTP